jgi:hypothetical protein
MDLENEYTPSWNTVTDVEEVWFAGCHCGASERTVVVVQKLKFNLFLLDVGGGSVPNGTRSALSRIPFRWMLRQCFLANTGILFHREMFKDIGLDPDTLYPKVKPRPPALELKRIDRTHLRTLSDTCKVTILASPDSIGPANVTDFVSEEHEELMDALCPMYDQLKMKMFWWVLEVLPQVLHFQKRDDTWHHELSYVF